MTAYTFGLSGIVECMQLAARRGVRCVVTVDRRQGLGRATRDMLAGMKAMKASGVEILLVNGKDIQEVSKKYANHTTPQILYPDAPLQTQTQTHVRCLGGGGGGGMAAAAAREGCAAEAWPLG